MNSINQLKEIIQLWSVEKHEINCEHVYIIWWIYIIYNYIQTCAYTVNVFNSCLVSFLFN